jgi:hypothetical protein
LSVEVRRQSASTLITKEVAQGLELSGEGLGSSALSQLSLEEKDQELLSVDL